MGCFSASLRYWRRRSASAASTDCNSCCRLANASFSLSFFWAFLSACDETIERRALRRLSYSFFLSLSIAWSSSLRRIHVSRAGVKSFVGDELRPARPLPKLPPLLPPMEPPGEPVMTTGMASGASGSGSPFFRRSLRALSPLLALAKPKSWKNFEFLLCSLSIYVFSAPQLSTKHTDTVCAWGGWPWTTSPRACNCLLGVVYNGETDY